MLFLVAAVFLFANLGEKYLWQDEAATAVLGVRLVKFGRPLAYDGVNLITMDHFAAEDVETLDRRTGDPEAAVRYYADRGDFRPDTAWTGQPWGSFLVAGASVSLFGRDTVAARAPFVLAALLTVGLLYRLVRREFRDPLLACLAAAVLVANVYWVIHARQCRYYALSGLMLVVTLAAFARWQRGRPLGRALFVAAAWCWFQVDFGSLWPTIGLFLLSATWTSWPRVKGVVLVGVALGAAVAPWVWYYQLAGRVKESAAPWSDKFLLNLANVNQFLIPLPLLLAAGVVLAIRWPRLDPVARKVLAVGVGTLLALLAWVPTVTPFAFYRYVVHATPLAALCVAWLACEVATWAVGRGARAPVAVALAAFVVACPFLSDLAMTAPAAPGGASPGSLLRPEWGVLYEEVFAPGQDPNRRTVEALARVASPGDEVLTNYEDIPLMFYTDYRVRGGMPCFRVEDASRGPPRFLVYRWSVSFVHGPVFEREVKRYRWRPLPSGIPDVTWGNIPDPRFRPVLHPASAPEAVLAENLGPAAPD